MIQPQPTIVAELPVESVHVVEPSAAPRVALAQAFADELATLAYRGACVALIDELEATRLRVIAQDVRSRTEAAWRQACPR